MNRSHLSTALVLSLAAAMSPVFLRAQAPASATAATKTSDAYLQGYLTMLEGDKLRKQNDYSGAYFKYRNSRDTFDALHAGDPSWQPEIIDYRRRKIRESMEEVRQLEIKRRADGGTPPSGAVPANPVRDPNAPLDVKPAIPATDEAPAPRDAGTLMDERIRALYTRIGQLEKRNEQLQSENKARESELLRIGKERLESQAAEKALKQRLIDTETKLETAGAAEKRKHQDLLKKVDELQRALNNANTKLAQANESLSKMNEIVAAVKEENRTLRAERESLTKEREQMMALLGSQESAKGVDKLKIVEENQRLKKELAAAQQKMAALSSEKEADRKAIAALKEQMRGVQDSLAAVERENEDYRMQIAALTKKLDATSQMLAKSGGAGDVPESEAVVENGVLREIILQQLKQQARRERARQNIMDELTREGVFDKLKETGVESENLLRAINEMATPVTLSKDQRDIIASTQVNKLLTNSDGKELYIVEKSDDNEPAVPAAPQPPTGANDKAGLSTEMKAYANAAEEHFAAGDFTGAGESFRKILLVEPQNVYALCNLGVTQLRLGSNEEAAETLMRSLAYNYDNDFAHYARGVALLRLGRLDDAVEELNEGLKINDKIAPAWHTLGLIAIKRGQREQAKENFLKAVALDPNCAEAHYNLAVIYATSNPQQLDSARKHYKMAINSGGARNSDLDKLLGMR